MKPVDSTKVANTIGRIKTLPTLPAVLNRILATTADADASAVDLSRHVASDPSLAATLLRVVNSAYYGHYRQIDSITTAIVMLGFYEVRNITLATTTFRTFAKGHPDFDRAQLWRHSVAAAIAAERLAKVSNIPAEGCFVAGLLHDIGKVALDAVFPARFRDAVHQAHLKNAYVREIEPEMFGLDHAEIGGILAEEWDLPPAVVEAIRHHHTPELSSLDTPLAPLIAVADFVAYQVGFGESSNGRECALPEAACTAGFGEAQWTRVCEDLAKNHEQLSEFLGALAG